VQTSFAAQSDALEKTKPQATALENAARERERYELHEIGPGAFVYRGRDGVAPPEPLHYLC
jgi:hypothetical protein